MTAKLTDPFSVTYNALSTGQPSWSGGYKCITINGQSALQYLTTSEMTWGDYYNFVRGKGDFSAARIAQVLQDDKVVAGVRRRFFSSVVEAPENKADLQAAIEQNVRAALRGLPQQQQGAVSLLASHMVGEPPAARSRATEAVALQNLFGTEEAVDDITRIVETAEGVDIEEAKKLIEEVFSYALPDDVAGPTIDAQIERGISVLLDKGVSIEEIFALFEKGYPENILTDLQLKENPLKRFIPLILRSLSFVDFPLPAMKEVLAFLRQKATANTMATAFIDEVQNFAAVLERNKKGNEDACLIVLPLLTSVLSSWPVGEFTVGAAKIHELGQGYYTVQSTRQEVKESVPGLTTFAKLVSTEPDVRALYDLRPKTFRRENEKLDFPLYFHHLLEAAKYTDAPAGILEKAIPLLSEYLKGTEYESFVEDLKNLLPFLKDDLKVTREEIIPLLESIVPKKGQHPTVKPEDAKRMLADGIFHYVNNAQQPATALLHCLPILQRQALGDERATLFEDIEGLLKILQGASHESAAVQRFVIPLLDGVIPKRGAVKLELSQASASVADCVFLINQGADLSQLLVGTFETNCQRLTTEAVNQLLRAREALVSSVQQQSQRRGGASQEFACRAAFLFQIGSLLDFDEGTVNVRFLPRIEEVFFGRGVERVPSEIPSAPLGSEGDKIMKTLLSALLKTPDMDYHETLQQAGVPKLIREFKAS